MNNPEIERLIKLPKAELHAQILESMNANLEEGEEPMTHERLFPDLSTDEKWRKHTGWKEPATPTPITPIQPVPGPDPDINDNP